MKKFALFVNKLSVVMSNKWLDDDDRWQEDDVEDFDPDKDYFTQKIQKKENNMLESTERSLRILEETENIGASTAVVCDCTSLLWLFCKMISYVRIICSNY